MDTTNTSYYAHNGTIHYIDTNFVPTAAANSTSTGTISSNSGIGTSNGIQTLAPMRDSYTPSVYFHPLTFNDAYWVNKDIEEPPSSHKLTLLSLIKICKNGGK